MVGSRVRDLTGFKWVIPSYLYLNGDFYICSPLICYLLLSSVLPRSTKKLVVLARYLRTARVRRQCSSSNVILGGPSIVATQHNILRTHILR